MAITDEIRKWARDREFVLDETGFSKRVDELCDHIDEEHEQAVQQAHADGQREQINFYDTFIHSNYIQLPTDAEGFIIHVGDMVRADTKPAKPFRVTNIMYTEEDGWLICGHPASRVYLLDTVEDILDSFADAYESLGRAERHSDSYEHIRDAYLELLKDVCCLSGADH